MLVTALHPQSTSFRLGQQGVQVSRAREQARKALFGWGRGEHADLAELIVSELVTNAICHGDGQVQVRLCMPAMSCGQKSTITAPAGRFGCSQPTTPRPAGGWHCSMA